MCLTAGDLSLTKDSRKDQEGHPKDTEAEFDWLIDAFLSQVVNQS